jgi:hypothetical protein
LAENSHFLDLSAGRLREIHPQAVVKITNFWDGRSVLGLAGLACRSIGVFAGLLLPELPAAMIFHSRLAAMAKEGV